MPEGLEKTLTFKKWRFGDLTVTRVLEMPTWTIDPTWILKVTAEEVKRVDWLRPDFANEAGEIHVNIQAFVIEAGGKRIVVDPCIGNDKPRQGPMFNMLDNPFLEDLAAAGFPRESIDIVLCTHLHVDHCGWNTMLVDGHWVPTFPNARYLFDRREFEYSQLPNAEESAEQVATFEDSIKPVFDAGLAELIDPDHEIAEGVRLQPSPGHTPGHNCIRLSSGGGEAIITGDMMHHPLQAELLDVCSVFCWDEAMTIETRRAILESATLAGDTILLGTHFAGGTSVRVIAEGDAFRMVAA